MSLFFPVVINVDTILASHLFLSQYIFAPDINPSILFYNQYQCLAIFQDSNSVFFLIFRFTSDVRSVLSRNLHQHRLWWSYLGLVLSGLFVFTWLYSLGVGLTFAGTVSLSPLCPLQWFIWTPLRKYFKTTWEDIKALMWI